MRKDMGESVAKRLLILAGFLALFLGSRGVVAKPVPHAADPRTLEVPGFGDAYYYRPTGTAQKPVLMYLHGRGGHPLEDCRKWAKVASVFGWVVCPSGPSSWGGGAHAWNNDSETARKVIDATIRALRSKFKGRVKAKGNVLIGFSEGAFIAQQVGVHDPDTWNRWLILAANDRYWFGEAPKLLSEQRKKIRRVFLFTGEHDMVAENTVRAGEMLKSAKVPVRVKIQPGLGHEVPADRMITNYRRPLLWLIRG